MLRQTDERAVELSGYIHALTQYIDVAIPAAKVEEEAGRLNLNSYYPLDGDDYHCALNSPDCKTTGCVLWHQIVALGMKPDWEDLEEQVDGISRIMGAHESYPEDGSFDYDVSKYYFDAADDPLDIRVERAIINRSDFQFEIDAITAGVTA